MTVTTEEQTRPVRPKTEDDERLRHIVERREDNPRRWKKVALCGAKVRDIHVEHNGEICQECVDIARGGA